MFIWNKISLVVTKFHFIPVDKIFFKLFHSDLCLLEIIFNQRNDPSLQEVITNCEMDPKQMSPPFNLENKLLYKQDKNGQKLLVIPKIMIESILKAYHHNDLLIHPSISRLYPILRSRFYWINMHRDCTEWVNACIKCQTT